MSDRIDLVVLWVDGADPQWQRQRQSYLPEAADNGSADNRFRDMGLLRYWFRGVERFAPWVGKVFFVTNGQIPPWLDTSHPKLRLVKHSDYIPERYLPTFNSNVIELFLHRIPDLSQQFVLFNDDMFLTAPVQPKDFFIKGLPVESALLDMVTASTPEDCLPHMLTNNAAILNRHFSKKEVLKQNFSKFYTLRYRSDLLRNLLLSPFRYFSTFRDPHLPSAYLKSTFCKVWQAEGALLESVGAHRFRCKEDLTHWLMKCWQICEGNFVPRATHWGRHYELWEDAIDGICKDIEKQRYRAICINDSKPDIDLPRLSRRIAQSFETILPQRSAFERDL